MIFVECFADETLIKTLGVASKWCKHSQHKSGVCHNLSRAKDSLGMVDEDPGTGQPVYYERMVSGVKLVDDRYIIVCHDKQQNNKLIILRPKLEDLILKMAQDKRVDLDQFALTGDADHLHKILMFSRNYTKFRAFEKLLVELSDHKVMQLIKSYLNS